MLVGHSKCTAVYIKSFGGQEGGLNEPPRIPLAYGPGSVSSLEVKEPQIKQQSLSHKGT